jgi:GNAT superfamily N-acetyltransferase
MRCGPGAAVAAGLDIDFLASWACPSRQLHMATGAIVKRATIADLSGVRETRLRALRDAPYAFASTYQDEIVQSEDDWRSRFDRGAWFLAWRDRRSVGIAAAYTDGGVGLDRHLVSMWVEPAERGGATATSLVEAVLAWAQDDGARAVRLWVADGNLRARRLYERLGFSSTGHRQPLPSDPSVGEEQLIRVF